MGGSCHHSDGFFFLSLKVAREGRGGVSLMYRLINQIGFLSLMDRQPFSSNRFFLFFHFVFVVV